MTSALIFRLFSLRPWSFNDKDIRVDIIKTAIRRDLERLAGWGELACLYRDLGL